MSKKNRIPETPIDETVNTAPKQSKKKKKTKNPEMNSGVMNMISDFTILRFTGMLGMRNVTFTKEELLKMNAQLNKIHKPKD